MVLSFLNLLSEISYRPPCLFKHKPYSLPNIDSWIHSLVLSFFLCYTENFHFCCRRFLTEYRVTVKGRKRIISVTYLKREAMEYNVKHDEKRHRFEYDRNGLMAFCRVRPGGWSDGYISYPCSDTDGRYGSWIGFDEVRTGLCPGSPL